MFDTLVFVGRFQPLHDGHLATMRRALAQARTLVVVLGSARRARNCRNPFSDDERERMILAAIADVEPAAAARIRIVGVRDWYDIGRWVTDVKRAVATVAPPETRIGLIGHAKDPSTYYLREFPDWPWVAEENHAGLSATDIRNAYFAGPPGYSDAALVRQLPPPVFAFLERFRATPTYRALAEETAEVARGKAAWAVAPFPPIFVTVDAVVTCREHVLMIRRGGHPGRGQWALPGGFVEQDERLEDAAMRELVEETEVALDAETLRAARRGSAVFDHPDRSVRGRTITHAYAFALGDRELPAIRGADDAAEARWIPLAELAAMETLIFEDHLHVIDRFVPVIR